MSLEKSEHLPKCQKANDCPRPASGTVYDLAAAQHIEVCRTHKREINRQNAQYIGYCQFTEMREGMRSPNCERFPVTVRYVDGEDMAVCGRHDSYLNQQFASLRNAPRSA